MLGKAQVTWARLLYSPFGKNVTIGNLKNVTLWKM